MPVLNPTLKALAPNNVEVVPTTVATFSRLESGFPLYVSIPFSTPEAVSVAPAATPEIFRKSRKRRVIFVCAATFDFSFFIALK